MKKKKILFFFPSESSFVKKDISLLSKSYEVKTPTGNWLIKRRFFLNVLHQFFFLIRNIRTANHVLIMFGGYWSFLPALFGKIFRRPVFIILGGTDCVSFPSMNYGSLRKPVQRKFIEWSYRLSTELLPVSETLILSESTYNTGSDPAKQGFKAFFPQLKTKYTVIYNGFDASYFQSDPEAKKERTFITLASTADMTRFKLKGLDLMIDLARAYPDCFFKAVGVDEGLSEKLSDVPENMKFYPFLPASVFREYLAESRFYLQLSISEGFPNALCEAMLCNCVPVGSSVGAIPLIIGDTGFILENRMAETRKLLFDKILSNDADSLNKLAQAARIRIMKNFDISRRESAMLDVLKRYESDKKQG